MPNHTHQVLLSISLITLLLVSLVAIWGLPTKRLRGWLVGLAVLDFIWVVPVILLFPPDRNSFWDWFFDSAAELTANAILSAAQLMLVGWCALFLAWRGGPKPVWQRVYWLILAALFIFLSIDEFFSVHESFRWWRLTYAFTGAGILFGGIALWWRSDKTQKKLTVLFLIGFGLMGFAGVFMDAVSNEGSIGPIPALCHQRSFGVACQAYGTLEEYFELLGAALMLFSLLATINARIAGASLRRIRYGLASIGGLWVFVMIGSTWIFPTITGYLFASPMRADYLNGNLSLVRGHISPAVLHPGDTLDVTLYTRVNDFMPLDYSMSVGLVSRPWGENNIGHDDMTLGNFEYPTYGWIPGLLVANSFHLPIPDDVPTPSSYRLVVSVWQGDPGNAFPVERQENLSLFDPTRLVLIDIPILSRDSTPPPPVTTDYRFNPGFSLTGYDLPETMTTGTTLDVRFWWETQTAIDAQMTHFLHFIRVDTGEQFDFNQQPFDGTFPTTDWPAALNVVDAWTITLPVDMPPGEYRVHTGMFMTDSANADRVPVSDANGQPIQDYSIVLATVTVRAP